MADNVVKLPFQKPSGLLHSLWIPLSALLGLLLIDSVLILATFTLPLLLLLVLGYMAVRSPPWVVFVWGLLYAGVVFTILGIELPKGYTDPIMWPYLGTATFFIGGVVISLLAGYRAKLEENYHALLGVVTSLPIAVVVSDISGNILLLNREAEKLLYGQVNDLAGLSYFSTFTSPDEQGRAIARYISYFDRNNFGPFSTTLQVRGDPPRLLNATLSIFGSCNHLYAITVIEKGAVSTAVQNEAGAARVVDLGLSQLDSPLRSPMLGK